MTHAELHGQVAKFVHGVDSHGELLIPYRHDWYCTWCDKLTDFIVGLQVVEGVTPTPAALTVEIVTCKIDPDLFRTEPEFVCDESLHLFRCPACETQGYCDGGGFCLHETHSQQ